VNWDSDTNTWEPKEHLQDCPVGFFSTNSFTCSVMDRQRYDAGLGSDFPFDADPDPDPTLKLDQVNN
jgi:hypothetical protein